MSEDKDYKEVLSGTVEEVKGKIRNLESPDYRELLRLEKKGEDRQKLEDFLKTKISALKGDDEEETEEQDAEDEEQKSQETDEVEETEDEESEDDESFMEKLNALSVGKLLLLGGFGGLIVGLLLGYGLGPSVSAAQGPGEAANSIQQLVDAGDFDGTADVGEPELRNGLYYFNVTLTQQTENGTETGYQSYYVTQDGELLFPEIAQNPFMPPVPMEIDQILAAQQQQQQDQPQPDQPAE